MIGHIYYSATDYSTILNPRREPFFTQLSLYVGLSLRYLHMEVDPWLVFSPLLVFSLFLQTLEVEL